MLMIKCNFTEEAMVRKLLVGILWVTLSLFVLGCSTSGEKKYNQYSYRKEYGRRET